MGFMDGFLRKKIIGKYGEGQVETRLVSDRANCSPETMEINKKATYKVISSTWRLIQTD